MLCLICGCVVEGQRIETAVLLPVLSKGDEDMVQFKGVWSALPPQLKVSCCFFMM